MRLDPFYLIVDSAAWIERLVPLGVKLVQLRIKDRPEAELRSEIRARLPGMMTLIALAITVAFVFSAAVFLGFPGMPLWEELASLFGSQSVKMGREYVQLPRRRSWLYASWVLLLAPSGAHTSCAARIVLPE